MDILTLDGIELAIDRRGPSSAPTVLLIAGGGQSMDWWTPEFCDLLSDDELQVIRYDHRDTGRSTTCPPGRPDYSGDDLATDPLHILDSLGIASAHLIGMSMGGGIAQRLAVRAGDRVRSLTLVESSPVGGDAGELPPPSPAVAATWEAPEPDVDWADENAVIEHRVEVERPYAGPGGLDEVRTRTLATREVRRTRDMAASLANHFLCPDGAEVDPRRIATPTLVVHSVDDPMFPIEHGEALVRMVPGAKLLRLEGVGHEIPPPNTWEVVVPAVRRHILGT